MYYSTGAMPLLNKIRSITPKLKSTYEQYTEIRDSLRNSSSSSNIYFSQQIGKVEEKAKKKRKITGLQKIVKNILNKNGLQELESSVNIDNQIIRLKKIKKKLANIKMREKGVKKDNYQSFKNEIRELNSLRKISEIYRKTL